MTKLTGDNLWLKYSRVQNSLERLFWAENQGNHQNFKKKIIPHMKPKVVFVHKYATPGFDNSKTTYILTYFQHTAL